MKTKYSILILFLALIACKSYLPFSNSKEKKEKVSLIKKKISLKNNEFQKIKKLDSVLFSLSNSLDQNIKLNLIKRRLDSFFLNSYSKKELLVILKLDRQFPNLKIPLEIDRRVGVKRMDFKNMEDLKKFMNNIDGEIEKELGLKKNKDSTNKKKQ